MKPEVSVIVATYNQEHCIGRTLESILAQHTDFSFEVIVGEDCSQDATRAVCERFARSHPETVRLMPRASNKGVVDNYFDCLEACRGDFITDCAGDDYWPSVSRLQLQRDYLRSCPEAVAVMSDWLEVSNGGERSTSGMSKYADFHRSLSGEEMLCLSLGCTDNFPLLSAMMFRRDALMAVYDMQPAMVRNGSWGCEDVPVVSALASQGAIGYLPLDAVAYEISGDSVSNSADPSREFDFYFRAAKCVATLVRHYGVDARRVAPGLDLRLKYLASLAWQLRDARRMAQLEGLMAQWPVKIPLKVKLRCLLSAFRR